MSVLGRGRNKITAVHLINSLCTGFDLRFWNFEYVKIEYQRINVLWNNTFRRIFNCCWRESTSIA